MIIKQFENRSEVYDEDGKVLYIGSNFGCMRYCDENQVITYYEGMPITRAILNKFFKMVEDPDNWKNPICAKFVGISNYQKNMISMAIQFYTGSVAKWSDDGKESTVIAKGYYLSCGA